MDEYFGFAVHGGHNRRFLLEDFTITHNVSHLRIVAVRSCHSPPSSHCDCTMSCVVRCLVRYD